HAALAQGMVFTPGTPGTRSLYPAAPGAFLRRRHRFAGTAEIRTPGSGAGAWTAPRPGLAFGPRARGVAVLPAAASAPATAAGRPSLPQPGRTGPALWHRGAVGLSPRRAAADRGPCA